MTSGNNIVAEISLICAGCNIPQRKFIAEANTILKYCELKNELHALGTNVEGPMDAVMVAIQHIRQRCHEMGAPKVDIHVNFSSRTEPDSMEDRKRKILQPQA